MTQEHCLHESAKPLPGKPRPSVLLIPPLFDESNRMRRTLRLLMRALSALGHASALPDLPGQNDSLTATDAVALDDWRRAFAEFAGRYPGPFIVASWRGGALIDDAASAAIGWWRMAPQSGASIVKTLMRARIAGDKEAGTETTMDTLHSGMARDGTLMLGGNLLSAAMIYQLNAASPAPVTLLRSVTPGAGEDQVTGSALWLRAEPGEDPAMATAMASDLANWAMLCAAG